MAERIKNLILVNLRIHRGPVTIGDVVYEPGGVCGPRVQGDYQLVVVHRGRVELRLDGERIEIPEQHGILLSPNHREHFLFAEDRQTRHSWCAIHPSAVPPVLRREFRNCRGVVPFGRRMATLLDLGREESPGGLAESESLQSGFYLGLGLALMCDFAAAVRHGGRVVNSSDEVFSRMEVFIRNEYGRALSLSDVAKSAGVSPQHLLKLCRLRARPTPMEQLYLRRLEASAEFLLHTGLAMGEIAERCGFSSPFHFSRKFKQHYGQSPLRWRQDLWKKRG